MHIMYVDESGTEDLTDDTRFFVIGGVIVHEDDLIPMEEKIQWYKDSNFYGFAKDAEIHLHQMYRSRGKFHGINKSEKYRMFDALFDAIHEIKLAAIVIVIDKLRLKETADEYSHILDYGYTMLTERFQMFLKENGCKGIMRVDKTTPPNRVILNEKDGHILEVVNTMRRRGTWFMPDAGLIVEEPHFLRSDSRKGLQVADAVSYCANKKFNGHSDFDSYWGVVASKLCRGHDGLTAGYGLKVYPDTS